MPLYVYQVLTNFTYNMKMRQMPAIPLGEGSDEIKKQNDRLHDRLTRERVTFGVLTASVLLSLSRHGVFPVSGQMPLNTVFNERMSRSESGYAYTGQNGKLSIPFKDVLLLEDTVLFSNEETPHSWHEPELARHYRQHYVETKKLTDVPHIYVITTESPDDIARQDKITEGIIVNNKEEIKWAIPIYHDVVAQELLHDRIDAKMVIDNIPYYNIYQFRPEFFIKQDAPANLQLQDLYSEVQRLRKAVIDFTANEKKTVYGTFYSIFKSTVPLPKPQSKSSKYELLRRHEAAARAYKEALKNVIPDNADGHFLEKMADEIIRHADADYPIPKGLTDFDFKKINLNFILSRLKAENLIDQDFHEYEDERDMEFKQEQLQILIQMLESNAKNFEDLYHAFQIFNQAVKDNITPIESIGHRHQRYLEGLDPRKEPIASLVDYLHRDPMVKLSLTQAYIEMSQDLNKNSHYASMLLQLSKKSDAHHISEDEIDIIQHLQLIAHDSVREAESAVFHELIEAPFVQPQEALSPFWDSLEKHEQDHLETVYHIVSTNDEADPAYKSEYIHNLISLVEKHLFTQPLKEVKGRGYLEDLKHGYTNLSDRINEKGLDLDLRPN